MRIRKHAAKLLLGSASPPHHSPPPPPTPPPPPVDDQSAAVGDGLFLCELNCSPWDAMDSNSFYFHQEGGEEGMEGIMGNVFGLGDEEGILGISEAFTRSVAVGHEPYLYCEDEDDSDPKKKLKRRRRRRKKEEENDDDKVGGEKTSSVVSVIAKSGGRGSVGELVPGICKKNDGKGWHCNRPAHPHHTLCDHHLAQLKSYSSTRHNSNNNSNSVAREEADADRGASVSDLARAVKKDQKKDDVPRVKTSRRPKTKAAVGTSSMSAGDGYYYYSGFGLQRGKSTRSNGGKDDLAGKNESESGDGSDAPIACDDLDDDDDDTDDIKIVGNVDNNKGRIRRKKRGRKPIKARSLKSLL